jgi:predicted RNase H-like HicB family nuclease
MEVIIMPKDRYAFPAIFNYADDGISIEFPDLPGCLPCAKNTEDAFKNAKEAMGLHLWGMEEDGETIPQPTKVENLQLEKDEISAMIEVFMPPIREKASLRFIKKTLSIPSWLNKEAEEQNINFSKTLQNALIEQLHVPDDQIQNRLQN